MSLRLKEVIWEVTLKCGRNCKFCGSKNVIRDTNPDNETIERITQELINYNVDTVVLSGGEPGELNPDTLGCIIASLVRNGRDVRIVTNGKVFCNSPTNIDKVTVIGISINSKDDFDRVYKMTKGFKKHTMITNFGTHNIFMFDDLAAIAQKFGSWQIQLTMGDMMLQPEGITYLRDKINKLKDVNYVIADNLQDNHRCSAGINTCGITADGDVIPCLSERSCSESVTVMGNLMEQSLKDIWENSFKEIRFSDDGWKGSCRNCIKYPDVKKCDVDCKLPGSLKITPVYGVTYPEDYEGMRLYGVTPLTEYHETLVYGVNFGQQVVVYGVTSSSDTITTQLSNLKKNRVQD